MGVSHDLRGDSWGCVPRSLFWREDLDGDGERGFDCLTFALVSSKAHREGCRASHGGFPYCAKDSIAVQHYGFSAKGLNEFLSSYPIPLEYDVILPISTQTIFDAPPEMTFRNFIYTEDDDDLAFLPKELSLGFGTGSPSTSVNTKLPKDVEEPEVQPAEITTRFRGVPPVKRKLAFGSSSSYALCAKTSDSKDDAPILSIYDDDEGLPDCFELKNANDCHLKIAAITPPA
ncbi:hypothetical protein Tco_0729528 [Tanacetum coccineum]|uniref:Uncharacterized protein n=1 Tax=Tanacetum coccineum TaxID=301880 RepID=A0ABQ4YRW8_9ASTR